MVYIPLRPHDREDEHHFMIYGFVVFLVWDWDTSTNDPIIDWRAAGGALPRGSCPVVAVDGHGNRCDLHGYGRTNGLGAQIEQVVQEGMAHLK